MTSATLTKILINPRTRGGRKLLTNPQAMHAAVRAAFPPDIDENAARILWRLDSKGNEHTLYITGPEKPTCTHIIEQAGWDTRPAQTADYERFLATLKRGRRWHFNLVANPTYSVSGGGKGKRGKVKAHVSVSHQVKWLHGKAKKAGFALAPLVDAPSTDQERARWSPHEEAHVIERWTDVFYRNNAETSAQNGRPVRIAKARFAGTLEITDPDLLQTALRHGIGRARGYGCGMLTLARMG